MRFEIIFQLRLVSTQHALTSIHMICVVTFDLSLCMETSLWSCLTWIRPQIGNETLLLATYSQVRYNGRLSLSNEANF